MPDFIFYLNYDEKKLTLSEDEKNFKERFCKKNEVEDIGEEQ